MHPHTQYRARIAVWMSGVGIPFFFVKGVGRVWEWERKGRSTLHSAVKGNILARTFITVGLNGVWQSDQNPFCSSQPSSFQTYGSFSLAYSSMALSLFSIQGWIFSRLLSLASDLCLKITFLWQFWLRMLKIKHCLSLSKKTLLAHFRLHVVCRLAKNLSQYVWNGIFVHWAWKSSVRCFYFVVEIRFWRPHILHRGLHFTAFFEWFVMSKLLFGFLEFRVYSIVQENLSIVRDYIKHPLTLTEKILCMFFACNSFK